MYLQINFINITAKENRFQKKKEKKTMNVLPDGFSIVATVMSHKLAKSFILENKMSIRRYQHITFQYLHFHQILKKG